MSEAIHSRNESLLKFDHARRQARRDQLSGFLQGRDVRMIPFEAVRSQLRQQNPLYRGLQDIPLDQVVGSVGRAHEFTRKFLPLNDGLRERWIGVHRLAAKRGWPPVEVYQVGNVYFAKDGNHRLSVAHQLEMATVEAHVWQFPDDITFESDAILEDVMILLGERHFQEKTALDQRIPNHGIQFTSPGNYTELLAQVESLRDTLALIDGEKMSYYDAVDAWYEMIYLPTIEVIKDSTLLSDFPGRTEADLFVWMSKHRDDLQQKYGDYNSLDDLARLMAIEFKEGRLTKLARQVRYLFAARKLPPLADTAVTGTNEAD
ncbi:MAG: hypothetical protein KC419_03725 [Anaerolineales bacterium]|nr:hypothetical protein [Anaerolineales bacterium]MCA9927555.1 hypothetical protein [Anaerolineales bacterium]